MMPERLPPSPNQFQPLPHTDFTRYIQTLPKPFSFPDGSMSYSISETEVNEVIKRFGQAENVVGFGSENVVMNIQGQPDKVYAFPYRNLTPEKAEEILSLQRCFSRLYPRNFPPFYAAFGTREENPSYLTGTIRQKLDIVKECEWSYNNPAEVRYPFPEIGSVLPQMGIPIRLDISGGNFVLATDGGVYYLDRIYLSSLAPEWNLEKTLDYMVNQGKTYSLEDIQIVKNSIMQLVKINRIALA